MDVWATLWMSAHSKRYGFDVSSLWSSCGTLSKSWNGSHIVKDAKEYYPSSLSYDQIFFTAALLSLVSIALSYIIKKTISSSDSQLQHNNRHTNV